MQKTSLRTTLGGIDLIIPLLIATFALFGSPCHAVVISLDPQSSDLSVSGTWHQRRLGSDDGTWWLPGGILLEMGMGREGNLPTGEGSPIWAGRWAGVSCRLTATGSRFGGEAPYGRLYNDADNLTDDSQSRTTLYSNGLSYTFSFDGTYFPATDEWDGTFSAVAAQTALTQVPESGVSLMLLGSAMAGICTRRRRH